MNRKPSDVIVGAPPVEWEAEPSSHADASSLCVGAAFRFAQPRRGRAELYVLGTVVAFALLGLLAWNVWGPGDGPPIVPPTPDRESDGNAAHVARLTPPDKPGGEYVGSETCKECHAQIAEQYQSHPMAHSLFPIREAPLVEDYEQTSFTPAADRRYQVERTDEAILHHEIGLTAEGEPVYDQGVPVDYALGSGRRGRAYLIDRDNSLYLSPVAWYSRGDRWDLSPGYDPQHHPRFERPATNRCLHCHSGQTAPTTRPTSDIAPNYEEPIFVEHAIGCERCHGPGGEHVRLRRQSESLKDALDPIVNPAKLEPARRDSVCNQCHLQGEHEILRYGRTHDDFRPGDHLGEVWSIFVAGTGVASDQRSTVAISHAEQMQSSLCFQASEGRMGCISCHDPHSIPAEPDKSAFYQAKCMTCHAEQGCALPEPQRQAAPEAGSCVACHMPQLPASDVPHTAQTDHRLLRSPDTNQDDGEGSASSPKELRIFDEAHYSLIPIERTRARGLMLSEQAEWRQSVELAQEAEPLLRQALAAAPDDIEVLDSLALVLALQGQLEASVDLWRQALEIDPYRKDILYSLAVHFHNQGNVPKALEYLQRLLPLAPWRAELHGRYSHLMGATGQPVRAIESARQALQLDPGVPRLYTWLAELYEGQGETERAERCRQIHQRLVSP